MRYIKQFNETFIFNGTYVDVSNKDNPILKQFREEKLKRIQISEADMKYIGFLHKKLDIPFHKCSEIQEDGVCYDYLYRRAIDNSNVAPYLIIHYEKFTNDWFFICVTLKGCEKKMYISNEIEPIGDLLKDLKSKNIFQK